MRAAIQKALAGKAKILFNGVAYENLEAMPPDVRDLYERVMGAAEAGTEQPGPELQKLFAPPGDKPLSWRRSSSDINLELSSSGQNIFFKALAGIVLLVGLIFLIKALL